MKMCSCEFRMGRSTSDKCELIPFDQENWRKCSTTVNEREGKELFRTGKSEFSLKILIFFHSQSMRRTEIRRMVCIRFDIKLGEGEKKSYSIIIAYLRLCACALIHIIAHFFPKSKLQRKKADFSRFVNIDDWIRQTTTKSRAKLKWKKEKSESK